MKDFRTRKCQYLVGVCMLIVSLMAVLNTYTIHKHSDCEQCSLGKLAAADAKLSETAAESVYTPLANPLHKYTSLAKGQRSTVPEITFNQTTNDALQTNLILSSAMVEDNGTENVLKEILLSPMMFLRHLPQVVESYIPPMIPDYEIEYGYTNPNETGEPVLLGEGFYGNIQVSRWRNRVVAVKKLKQGAYPDPEKMSKTTVHPVDLIKQAYIEARVTQYASHMARRYGGGSIEIFGITPLGWIVFELVILEHSRNGEKDHTSLVYFGQDPNPVVLPSNITTTLYEVVRLGPRDPTHLDRMTPADWANVMGDVAMTLAALHDDDIVHADVKETNIFLKYPYERCFPMVKLERIKGVLADYGYAAQSGMKISKPEQQITPAEFSGKEYFMSWTKSADVWQLGKVLENSIRRLKRRGLNLSHWKELVQKMLGPADSRPSVKQVGNQLRIWGKIKETKPSHA